MAAALPSAQRLEALQALRAGAAGLVVFSHALDTFANRVDVVSGEPRLALGTLGVKVFFVISGYIICVAGMKLLEGSWANVSFFVRRRLIRIVPIYWIATSIYALKLTAEGEAPTWVQYLKSLFFIPYDNGTGLMRPVLGQGWTLNFEMAFYLVFALCLFLRGLPRYLAMTAILGLLALARPLDVVSPSDHLLPHAVYLLADSYLLYFLAGVWLCLTFARFRAADSQRTFGFATLILATVGVVGLYLALSESGLVANPRAVYIDLPICLAVVAICALPTRPAPDTSSLGGRVRTALVRAGDGSYSTYLTHGFLLGPAGRVLAAVGITFPAFIFATGSVIVCAFVGWVIFRWVEQPLMVWMNSRWGSRRPSALPTTS